MLSSASLLGWEHVNLTGDYSWQPSDELKSGEYRPLRTLASEGSG